MSKKRKSKSCSCSEYDQIELKGLKVNSIIYLAFRDLLSSTGASSGSLQLLVEVMMENVLNGAIELVNTPGKKSLHFSELIPIFETMFPYSSVRCTDEQRQSYKSYYNPAESSATH